MKWKNYGLWLSLASTILMLLQAAGVHIVPETYNTIVNGVLGVLVALGVVSNPSQGAGYVDKQE